MFSPLALILIPAGYLFLWPLVSRLLCGEEGPAGGSAASPLQVALTALSLSIGGLAWLLFWIGLLPGRLLTPLAALLIVVGGLAPGLALNPAWFAPRRWLAAWRELWQRLTRLDAEALLALAILGSLTVILVYNLYYPFIDDDTLLRYGPQAQAIYAARRFPEAVSGYPPLAPLSFVATWFAAGQPNEHLARVFSFVMAGGTLGATYLVGRHLLGRLAGLSAAALVALTPLFVANAAQAYTDIPATFPLILAVFYALRWWDSARFRDAALAGVLLAIALFTKQSALTWLVSLCAVPLLWLAVRRDARRALLGLAGIALPSLLIAAPWYARNVLLDGWHDVVPVAGLLHVLIRRTGWLGLVPPLAWPQEFGPPLVAWYALGWGIGLARAAAQGWRSLRGSQAGPPADLILAAAVLPYWLAWWTNFSFDARFLLLVLPLMAVWAARPLWWAYRWLGERVRLPRPAWQIGGGVLLFGLLIWGVWGRLGGVYHTLTNPFISDMERLRLAKPSLADVVVYARANLDPQTDRLCLMDERMAYYLGDYQIDVFYPDTLADLEGCDYLFHISSIHTIYGGVLGWDDSEFYRLAFHPEIFEPVYESGGVHVMRVLVTYIPWEQERP